MQSIETLTSLVVAIGKKTSEICLIQVPWDGPSPDKSGGNLPPIDNKQIEKGILSYPYWTKKIFLKGIFDGHTVESVISQIASVSILTGFFFMDSELTSVYYNKFNFADEIHNVKENLRRLSSPIAYERIMKRFPS